MQKTGSEIICESLIAEGVRVVFGYPGGSILPLYDTLPRYTKKLRHILTRHEQGAAFAADGYARASGDVGVCLATSGPGATNLITGIANAYLDSIPLVAITAQVTSPLIGTDAFQEADITGVTLPITKHNYLITDPADLAPAIKEAFHLARTGRPGPVHIDVAKDVQINATEYNYAKTPLHLPGYKIFREAKDLYVERAVELIQKAHRPVVITGHGVIISGASRELKTFVQKTDATVVSTLLGLSAVPYGTRHYLGMLGMHGSAAANYAVAHADLVIGVGIRFDDRITGRLDDFAREAKVIHIDTDPAEVNKIIPADVAIIADAKSALTKLNQKCRVKKRPNWHQQIETYSAQITEQLRKIQTKPGKRLRAVEVIHAINKISPDATLVSDVGQNQMWAAMHFRFRRPGQYLASGGLGSMGYGLPAALGAQVARGTKPVWCVTGDGGIQMNIQELTTLVQDKIPLKIAVLNNGFLGMVRQWQELFYQKNYSSTPLLNPDFIKLARACGLTAYRVTKPADALKITQLAEKEKGPVLVEYLIEREENVFPMVPPGEALRNTRIK